MIGKKIRSFGAALLLLAVASVSCSLGSVTEVVSGDTFSKNDQAYSLGVEKYKGDGYMLKAQFGLNSVNSAMVEKISEEEKPLHLYFDVDGKQIEVYKGEDFAFKIVTSGEEGKRVVNKASWADEEGGGFAYRQGTGTVDENGKAQIKWGATRYSSKTGDRAEWLLMSKLYGEGTNSMGKLFAAVTDKITVDMLDMNQYEFDVDTGYYVAPLSSFVKGDVSGKDGEVVKAKFDIDGDLREFVGNGVEVDLEFADSKPETPAAVANESEPSGTGPSGEGTNPSGEGTNPSGEGTNPSGEGTNPSGEGTNPSGGNGGTGDTQWSGGTSSGEIDYELLEPYVGNYGYAYDTGYGLDGAHGGFSGAGDNVHIFFKKDSEFFDLHRSTNWLMLTKGTISGSSRTVSETYYASIEPGYLAYRRGTISNNSGDGKFTVEWSGDWVRNFDDDVYKLLKKIFYSGYECQKFINAFTGDDTMDLHWNQIGNRYEYMFVDSQGERTYGMDGYYVKIDGKESVGHEVTIKYARKLDENGSFVDTKNNGRMVEVDIDDNMVMYISHEDPIIVPAFPEATPALFGTYKEGDVYTSTGLYVASKGNATGLNGKSIKHDRYIEIGSLEDYEAMIEQEKGNGDRKSRAAVLFYDALDYDYDYLLDDAIPSCCNADRLEAYGSQAMPGGDSLMPYWTMMQFTKGLTDDATGALEAFDSDIRLYVVQIRDNKYKYASKANGALMTANSPEIANYSFEENFNSKSWYVGKESQSYYENRMNFGFAELYSWLKYWSMTKSIPIYDNGHFVLYDNNTGLEPEEKFELINDIEEIKISRRVCNGAKNNFEEEYAFQLLNLSKIDWGGFADAKYEAIKSKKLKTWILKDYYGGGITIQGSDNKEGIDRNARMKEPALVLFEDGVPVRAVGHCYLDYRKAQPFQKGDYNTWQVQLRDVEVIN